MSNYSQELKSVVVEFVNQEYKIDQIIPVEIALSKKEFPNEQQRYSTDELCEDDFVVPFEDIVKIIKEKDNE